DHLHKVAYNAMCEYKRARIHGDAHLMEVAYNKRQKILQLIEDAYNNKNKYQMLTTDQLRKDFYCNGVDVPYISRDSKGNIKKQEVVHYKMLFRSTGKAKKGSCMFIRKGLYKRALRFLRMGITSPKGNPMLVELSAYSPLVSSGIFGRVKINPRNILILKDVDRFFNTDIVSIEIDGQKQCIAKYIEKDRKSTRLNSSHVSISYAVFCLKI